MTHNRASSGKVYPMLKKVFMMVSLSSSLLGAAFYSPEAMHKRELPEDWAERRPVQRRRPSEVSPLTPPAATTLETGEKPSLTPSPVRRARAIANAADLDRAFQALRLQKEGTPASATKS